MPEAELSLDIRNSHTLDDWTAGLSPALAHPSKSAAIGCRLKQTTKNCDPGSLPLYMCHMHSS